MISIIDSGLGYIERADTGLSHVNVHELRVFEVAPNVSLVVFDKLYQPEHPIQPFLYAKEFFDIFSNKELWAHLRKKYSESF